MNGVLSSAAAGEDVGVTVTRTASAYSAPEAPAPPASTAKTYEVQRRDTLWALAERYLGDPLRYAEIVELNATAVGPDNEIYPGTVLVLPSDATGLPPAEGSSEPAAATVTEEVTVEPGDTLWELAEEVTGSGQNWRHAHSCIILGPRVMRMVKQPCLTIDPILAFIPRSTDRTAWQRI